MGENWRGKAVSIECDGNLGVFQGIIKSTTETNITISRAFRNGVPLKKQHAEITLRCADIKKISLIPAFDGQNTITPAVNSKPNYVKKPNFSKSAPNLGNAISSTQSNIVTANNHNNQKGQNQKQQQPRPSTSKGDNVNLNKQFNNLDISTRVPNNNNNASNDLLSNGTNGTNNKSSPPNWCSNSVAQFFGNLIPPKVEVRMGASCSSNATTTAKNSNNAESNSGLSNNINSSSSSSKPIDIVYTNGSYYGQPQNSAASSTNSNGKMRTNGNGNSNGNGYSMQFNGNTGSNSNKKQRKNVRRDNSFKQKQTFGTSVDDPEIYEEFDFEGNLALFDKQALWHVIEKAEQKPDGHGRQLEANTQTKFRHDENIIESEPLELRQIESTFASYTEFVTDDGLIIPTIPMYVRTKIESTAEKSGMLFSRQYEILARGVCDLAILLLGGARRLTPNNCHQWPKIVIICDTRINTRAIDVGATTGRQLASHGLSVTLYLEDKKATEHNTEITLFKATENKVVDAVSVLPNPDLVILSTNSPVLTQSVKNWLRETRASILSIDPPPNGVPGVSIKYSILPILPLNGISTNNCGKLYLCNLGIPDIYFRDAGVKYKSPFGHKSILPIHLKD